MGKSRHRNGQKKASVERRVVVKGDGIRKQ